MARARASPGIVIRPAIQNYLRPLTASERAALEKSLLADGCLAPLVVWSAGAKQVLVDGHNRYEICQKHGIPFDVKTLNFTNEEEAQDWIDRHGRGQRNRTKTEDRYYLGLRYNREKGKQGGKREGAGRGKKSSNHSDDLKTAQRIAHDEGVGQTTVERAGKFTAQVDELDAHIPGMKWRILSEEVQFTPKLANALVEAEPAEAQAAIAAVQEELAVGKPIKASAILKEIGWQPEGGSGHEEAGESSPVEAPEPFDIDTALYPFDEAVDQAIGRATAEELQSFIALVLARVSRLQCALKGKQAS